MNGPDDFLADVASCCGIGTNVFVPPFVYSTLYFASGISTSPRFRNECIVGSLETAADSFMENSTVMAIIPSKRPSPNIDKM